MLITETAEQQKDMHFIKNLLFAKKISIFTLAGFKDERVQVTIFPPVLKRRSEGALVAGTQRYLRAMVHSCG